MRDERKKRVPWEDGFPDGASGKESTCQCRGCKRRKFDSWIGKIPGGGHGNPSRYSCLGNPMDKGAEQAVVHGAAKSQRQLNTPAHTMRGDVHVLESAWAKSQVCLFLTVCPCQVTYLPCASASSHVKRGYNSIHLIGLDKKTQITLLTVPGTLIHAQLL